MSLPEPPSGRRVTGVHAVALQGFGAGAGDYERARPGYPAPAVACLVAGLGIGAGTTVVDLAAGTGKLTRELVPTGARVVAVEPVEAMWRRLCQVVPGVAVVAASAEALPLGTGTADAVTVAQAFHWLDAERALAEIHRVLRPGGALGLAWNSRDERVDWVAQLATLLRPWEGDLPRGARSRSAAAVTASPLFGPLEVREFAHAPGGGPENVVARVASISFVAALDRSRRERVLEEVRQLLATHPQTAGRATLRFPYRTSVEWCRRVDGR